MLRGLRSLGVVVGVSLGVLISGKVSAEDDLANIKINPDTAASFSAWRATIAEVNDNLDLIGPGTDLTTLKLIDSSDIEISCDGNNSFYKVRFTGLKFENPKAPIKIEYWNEDEKFDSVEMYWSSGSSLFEKNYFYNSSSLNSQQFDVLKLITIFKHSKKYFSAKINDHIYRWNISKFSQFYIQRCNPLPH